MNKTILIAIVITFFCVEYGQGLQCYQHDYCIGGCPTLSSSIVQCESSQSKCWKFSSPIGTKRGCGDHRCMVQLDTGIMGTASVCCTGSLCNSAMQIKTTTAALIFGSLMVFVYTYCI